MHIYDFDGTLVSTKTPDTGKIIYEEKTGTKWPHKGWWSKRESLDINIFNADIIEDVNIEYKKSHIDLDTVTVMMTGRITPLSKQVEIVLESHNLKFDEYHYNTGGSTEVCKMNTIVTLLGRYLEIREIKMFDDRIKHIPIFEKFGQDLVDSGRLDKYEVVLVPGGDHNE